MNTDIICMCDANKFMAQQKSIRISMPVLTYTPGRKNSKVSRYEFTSIAVCIYKLVGLYKLSA